MRKKLFFVCTICMCLVTTLALAGINTIAAAPTDDFVTTWKTDNPGTSNSTSITIPTTGTGYAYQVDWNNDGDFLDTDETTINTGSVTHDFGTAGTYTIRITGNFPRIYFNNGGDKQKILSIDQWGTGAWTSMESAFYGASNLTIPATDTPDFSAVTSMKFMFVSCAAANPNTSSWDTSAVTNMHSMFDNATSANPDTGSWDTSSVINMESLFNGAVAANPDTSFWDTSSVTNMSYMFYNATTANPDTSSWNTAAVTDISYMFYNATAANPDVSNWDMSNVTNMSNMFRNATATNPDISNWDVSNVTDMSNMFLGVTLPIETYDAILNSFSGQSLQSGVSFHGGNSKYCVGETARNTLTGTHSWIITDGGLDCSGQLIHFVTTWKTDNPGTSNSTSITIPTTGTGYAYQVDWNNDGDFLDADETTINTGSVTHDFGTAGTYTIRITGNFPRIYFNNGGDKQKILSIDQWGTGAWTSMESAFYGASNLTIPATDTPGFSAVTSMKFMFVSCAAANPNTSSWDTSAVTNMHSMFDNATSANPDTGSWDTSSVINMESLFNGAVAANPDTSFWDTSSVTNMSYMFYNATTANPDTSSWNTAAVTDISYMFYNATAANPDTSSWNTAAVTGMNYMFYNATAANPDTGSWNTATVTSMKSMFEGATAVNPDTSAWDVSSVTTMQSLFQSATTANPDVSSWNTSAVTNMQAMFAFATTANPDTSSWNTAAVTTMKNMFWGATAANPDVSSWDVTSVTNMTNMFKGVTLSSGNYDALLTAFDAQALQPGVTFHGGNSNYCNSQTARNNLIASDSWTITDGGLDCSEYLSHFVTTWKTDHSGTSNSTSITIPTTGTGYAYQVDWNNDGDFLDTDETTVHTGDVTHDFGSAGTYTIRITGDFPRIYFNNSGDRQKILSITQWGTRAWASMENAFYGASNLTVPATDTPDFSTVTNMSRMFFNATAANPDTGSWNTAAVTDISRMFYGTNAANPDVSNWDVSSVTNMSYMFYNANAANPDTSNWNTSSVTNMFAMFASATSANPDTGTWDTSSVTTLAGMFENATSANPDVSGWNTSSVVATNIMFNGATVANPDVSNWDMSNVTNMSNMFRNATTANPDISNWDVSNVTDMANMFLGVTLPTETYDAILNSFSGQSVQSGVSFHGGSSKYCAGETARNTLTGTHGWTITDGGLDCSGQLAHFITTWKTDNAGTSNSTSITIPTTGSGYAYQVDWNNDGDFFDTDEDTVHTGDVTHDFGSAGTYTIRVKGNFPRIWFNNSGDKEKILSITQWGTGAWTSMEHAFHGASNLTVTATDTPDFSAVTSMKSMFEGATAVNPDTSAWDVSAVTTMQSMFQSATAANPDTSSWNTSAVTNMQAMFAFATTANPDTGSWNTAAVTTMQSMFWGATSTIPDTSSWDVSLVTNMNNMFKGVTLSTATYDTILYGFDAQSLQSGVTFHGGNSNYCNSQTARNNIIASDSWTITDSGLDCSEQLTHFVTTWKTDNPGTSNFTSITIPTTGTGYVYQVDWNNDGDFLDADEGTNTGSVTHDFGTAGTYTIRITGNFPRIYVANGGDRQKILSLDQWGTQAWASMESAFFGASNLTFPATDTPDLSAVTNMTHMFYNAVSANPNTSNWDTSSVTNMSQAFYNADAANPDTSNWNTSSVTNMNGMFEHTDTANPDVSNWNTASVTKMKTMFTFAKAANPDVSNWDMSSVTEMESMFRGALVANPDVSNWDVSSVTTMEAMFYDNTTANPDVSNWDTSSVTHMSHMFRGAYSANPDVSNWDVSNVVTMGNMFLGVTLPTETYDAILNSFSGQSVQSGVSFHGGNSKYCAGETARNTLTGTHSWTITDGGLDCSGQLAHFITTWKTDNAGTSNFTSITIPTTGSGYAYQVDWNNDGDFFDTGEDTVHTGDVTHDFGTAGTYTIRIKGNFPRIYFNNGGDKEKVLSITQWGTGSWTSMKHAFHGAANLTITATDTPDFSAVTSMKSMFEGATSVNPDTSAWDVSAVTTMQSMFQNATAATPDVSSWNTSAVTNMQAMFAFAVAANPDTSSWNTAAVTTLQNMFWGATAANPDVSSWDVTSVTNMSNMFKGVTLPTASYDAILNGFSTQSLQSGVSFHGGNSTYCAGETARNTLIGTHGWVINDGGKDCGEARTTNTGETDDPKLLGTTPKDESEVKYLDSEAVLFQIYPNPFKEKATVRIALPESVSTAEIIVYGIAGRKLQAIPVTARGKASIEITNHGLQAGMYFYTLIADGRTIGTKRMILTR